MPPRNATTITRVCRAGLAGLALVVLSASLAYADFGPRTTIGKNYQQWSDTASTDGIDPGSCSGVGTCFVVFQPIPQQQPLIVQHVACAAIVSAGGLRFVSLGTRKGGEGGFPQRLVYLVPVSTAGTYWVVNSPAMHLIKSGERPVVAFVNSADANWTVACSISGKLK